MNATDNDNSLFNKLPVSILSTIFVLAQNPQLSLLNKNMHYVSQQVDTISNYILQYIFPGSKTISRWELREIFDKYTRINTNETIGMLVLRKIKNLDYETALELAFEYRWRNVLNKLLKMYVVIDRNTSEIVYKGTLFINEDEYLDIDIVNLLSEESELQRELSDIKLSHSLYIRPLITFKWVAKLLEYRSDPDFEKELIEALIDAFDSKIEIPTELAGSIEVDFRYIDSKDIIYITLSCVYTICRLNNLELLKRILSLKINTKISFQDLKSHEEYYNMLEYKAPTYFIENYGYETKMDMLVYMTCSYYSIGQDRKKLIEFLENNDPNATCQQILFDAAVYRRNKMLVKDYFFKVEQNSENIRKVTRLAYVYDNVDLIRLLLDSSDKLKGELDESALKAAIKNKKYGLVEEIITKYPNTVNISCLEQAVDVGDIRIAKLLIESGVDLKLSEFKGAITACKNKDIDMLQLLLENGASVELVNHNVIEKMCSINNYDIAKRLLETFDRGEKTHHTYDKVTTGARLRFNKTIMCLIEVLRSYDEYNEAIYEEFSMHSDFYTEYEINVDFDEFCGSMGLFERVMAFINSKKKDIANAIKSQFKHLPKYHEFRKIERISFDKLLETIEYIIENNLQSTFDDIGYDEANEFGYVNNVEVLNDRHYEQAKLELVNRNFEMLKLLIDRGVDINSSDSLILRTAYKGGDIGWINYFISKGLRLKDESDGFEEACKSDRVEVLKHWIRNGGVVPKVSRYECINMACLLGNFDMIKLLVENGVDLSNPERNGIRIACRLGFGKTLKYLLDNNAVVGNICRYQLEYACLIEDIVLVKMILEYYVDLGALKKGGNIDTKDIKETKDITFLDNENTDRSEEYRITKILLEKGKPIQNSDLLNGIRAAIAVANTEILKLLLSYQIDLNNASEILIPVIENENIEVVVLLLENGLNIKGNSSTLHVALRTQNVEIVRLLLQYGAELKSNTKFFGYSPLGKIEIVQLLLSYCSQVGGDSHLLRHAVYKNNLDAVKLLLKGLTTLENSEYNYVFDACKNNNMEILKLLFENGARIQKGSESGVIEACENNNLEILKLLFDRNPNLVLKKDYGLKEAIDHKNSEMIKLLIDHGADTSAHTKSIIRVAHSRKIKS